MGLRLFNKSVSIIGSANNSNAGFALCHNPEFTKPFVPAGTYLVKINFERGVSVVKKAIKN